MYLCYTYCSALVVPIKLLSRRYYFNQQHFHFLPGKVVYVGDGGAYVPVPSLKSRPLSPNLQALQTLQGLQGLPTGSGTGVAGDDDWRRHPETWDREHRRYRPNTTRVQRECKRKTSSFSLHFLARLSRRMRLPRARCAPT